MRRLHLALVSLFLLASAACGGDSLPERVCDRAEECGELGAQSRDECVAEGEAVLDALSPAERDAVKAFLEACLELETCAEVAACLNN